MIVKFNKKFHHISTNLIIDDVDITDERFDLPRLPELGEIVTVHSSKYVTAIGTVNKIKTHVSSTEAVYIITLAII